MTMDSSNALVRSFRSSRAWIVLAIAMVAIFGLSHFVTRCGSPARAAEREIVRVLLGEDGSRLRIRADALRCVPAAPFALDRQLEVRTQSNGLLVLGPKGQAWAHDDASLEIHWDGPATLQGDAEDFDGESDDERPHFGHLVVTQKSWPDRPPSLRRVLHADLDLYVTGVIAAEMGARFPPAALEAQAIAARGFALSARSRRSELDFDLFDDDKDQVYRGVPEDPSLVKAVRATLSMVLTYDGKPIRSYYSSTCGGATRDGFERFEDVPRAPFRGVECTACSDSPRFRWTRRIPRSAFAAIGHGGSGRLTITPIDKSARGDWRRMRVKSRGKSTTHSASTLSRLQPMPSLWIEKVDSAGDGVVVHGRGFGHGVGLCQYGARGYALRGWTHEEILAHYFPGTTVETIERTRKNP